MTKKELEENTKYLEHLLARIKEILETKNLTGFLSSFEKYVLSKASTDVYLKDSRAYAERLWELLDDIDTASDMYKPVQDNTYTQIMNTCMQRTKVFKSDGYTLMDDQQWALYQQKCSEPNT